MWPNYVLDHPDNPLLFDYDRNCLPVDCDGDWTLDIIILMLEQGSHVSAKNTEAIRKIHKETL